MSQDNEYIQELLHQARSGNRAGMGHLAVIVRSKLQPFILRTTLDYDLTEDILQETLLCMLGHLNSLRDCRRFWPWVFRIAWNKFQDCLRRRELQSSLKTNLACNLQFQPQTDGNNPLQAGIRGEILDRLAEALEQLSKQQQDVIRLRYYEQLSFASIADMTSVSPSKARAQCHRAKQMLKKRML
jgi:RNA polymerase sigma-70 factor (ECF subfamily)